MSSRMGNGEGWANGVHFPVMTAALHWFTWTALFTSHLQLLCSLFQNRQSKLSIFFYGSSVKASKINVLKMGWITKKIILFYVNQNALSLIWLDWSLVLLSLPFIWLDVSKTFVVTLMGFVLNMTNFVINLLGFHEYG